MSSGDELRAAMRRFPCGIAVVTTEVDGVSHGITVGSLVSLSLEPPLVGVSVGLQTPMLELLRRAEGFSISLLRTEQESIAAHFAMSGMPPIARWAGIETKTGTQTPPLVAGALAWLECTHHAELEVGDHVLFVGKVATIELGEDGQPLIYLQSTYISP